MKEENAFVSDKHWCNYILFLFIFVLTNSSFKVIAGSLIINHISVDMYGQIPPYWIAQVKKMWFTVPGESHSSGYRIEEK